MAKIKYFSAHGLGAIAEATNGGGTTPSSGLGQNLAGYWGGTYTNDALTDDTENGNQFSNLNLSNPPQQVEGLTGDAISIPAYNGTYSILQQPNSTLFNNDQPFTISLWFKLLTTTNAAPLSAYAFSSDRGFAVYTSNGKTRFELGTGGSFARLTHTLSISVGDWYHVVCRSDSVAGANGLKPYSITVNDTDKLVGEHSLALTPSSRPIRIGAFEDLSVVGRFEVQHIGRWNGRILSDADVTALYNGGIPLTYQQLLNT